MPVNAGSSLLHILTFPLQLLHRDRHTGVSGASDKRLIIDNSGNIVPPTTSPGRIGTSSLKWPDIWCTTLHQGDLMYENGVRTTEDGDGIAFYNPHIKGDIVKDL